jgi:hypothetical protein
MSSRPSASPVSRSIRSLYITALFHVITGSISCTAGRRTAMNYPKNDRLNYTKHIEHKKNQKLTLVKYFSCLIRIFPLSTSRSFFAIFVPYVAICRFL